MKKEDVKVGGEYLAKVTNKVVRIRIVSEHASGGWTAINPATNKTIRVKSAQRLRGPATDPGDSDTSAELKELLGPDKPKRGSKKKAPAKKGSAKKTSKKAPKPKADRKPSGLDLAAKALKTAGESMNAKDIAEAAIKLGWETEGKTPHATLYAAMLREINVKGSDSRFERTERGHFKYVGD